MAGFSAEPGLLTTTLRDGVKVVGSILSNPGGGTLLVDTGALAAGNYLVGFIISHTAATYIDVQHRDSTNTANIENPIRLVYGGGDTEYPMWPSKITIALNQRLRVVMAQALVGDIQASVFLVLVV